MDYGSSRRSDWSHPSFSLLVMNLSRKKIAVLGAGQSGLAAAQLIEKKGGRPHVFDTGKKKPSNWPPSLPLTLEATEETGRAFGADLIVLSPGIETESPFVHAFCEKKGSQLWGETELACRFYSGRIVAITGTNGKTTTTALIEKILLDAGKSACACGNYGLPLSAVLLREDIPDFLSLELSSFQLESMVNFHPEVALWLNFAPDHLDRYPTEKAYYEAKLHIFDNQKEEDIAIIRAGSPLPALKALTLSFSSEGKRATLSYKNSTIFEGKKALLSLKGTSLDSKHNAENAMAAILATRALGISLESIEKTFQSFLPPLHRCEVVRTLRGVTYLNDSKATNLHALEAALKSQTHPVILLVGGKDKGLDYTPLCPLLEEKVRHCLAFGQIKEQLANTFEGSCPITLASSLEEVVEKAAQYAVEGDIVLFSPGTSSFDMFTGYEHRGEVFKSLVQALR